MTLMSGLTREQCNKVYEMALTAQDTEQLRRLCKEDLFFLLTVALRRKDADNDYVYNRCREVEVEVDDCMNLWSREHYKSSIGTFALPIQEVLKDANVTIGIFSHTRPIAKAFLFAIKTELETNSFLKNLFKDVLYTDPQKESPKWSLDDGLIVKRKSNAPTCTLEAWGLVDGQPTSKHFAILNYDDVVTLSSVTSPEMIEKTTNSWRISLNLGSEQVGKPGRKRYWGTRYHQNDTYSQIIETGSVKVREFYPTSLGKNDIDVAGEPLLMTRETLLQKRKSMGLYVYATQMLQNPAADRVQGFKTEWLQYYECLKNNKNWNYYIICDPSGEKKKKTSDYTVFVVIGLAPDKNYYLVDMVRDRLSLNERTTILFEMIMKWNPKKIGYEEYGKDSDIAHIKYIQEEKGFRFSVEPLAGFMPKPDRIRRLQPIFEASRFFMPRRLPYIQTDRKMVDLVQEFIAKEYIDFPVGSHDDMCLVGETLVKTINGNLKLEDIKEGDYVLTRSGYQKVLRKIDSGRKEVIKWLDLVGTQNHPVITTEGVKRLDSLHVCDMLYIWNEKLSSIEEKSTIDILIQKGDNIESISGDMINGKNPLSLFIDKFISTISVQFQRVTLFIIEMKILLIITLQIFNVYLSPNICAYMQVSLFGLNLQLITQRMFYILNRTNKKQENGTQVPQERIGIFNMPKNHVRKVYNLTVENTNEYFANNILVHNCDAISRILDDNLGATFPKYSQRNPEEDKNSPDAKFDILVGNTPGATII